MQNILPPGPDDSTIWDTWLSQYRLPTVTVADEVGTFRELTEKAMTTQDLAQALEVDARALSIHLGVLGSLGLVEKRQNKWRATATVRQWLHPDAEGYYGPAIHGFREANPLHAQLKETLSTGDKASSHHSAVEEWERGELPPDLAKSVTAYMNAHSRATSRAVAMLPIFSDINALLDVGGGSGIFSIQIAKAWPSLRATIMEIPAICSEADGYIEGAGVSDSVDTRAVDMFREDWLTGYDAHFLSNVFHDWSDETCRLLAKKSFAALPSGGRILLHEMLMDDDGCGPYPAAAFSLLMLLGTRGKQYSLPEFSDILSSAGFVDVEAVRSAYGYYSLVSARKP